MPVGHASSSRVRMPRRTALTAAVVALSAALAGCTSSAPENVSAQPQGEGSQEPSAPPVSKASVESSIPKSAKNVSVDEVVTLTAEDGTFEDVAVTIGKRKKLNSTFSAGKTV